MHESKPQADYRRNQQDVAHSKPLRLTIEEKVNAQSQEYQGRHEGHEWQRTCNRLEGDRIEWQTKAHETQEAENGSNCFHGLS